MDKNEHKLLRQLVNTAKLVGYNLVLGDKIDLITYTKRGKISQIYHYDYDELNCIQNVATRINEKAASLRSEWGRSFLEFAPISFSANHRIVVGEYTADAVALVDVTGKPILESTGTAYAQEGTHEAVMLSCPFSSEGLHQMSDYFTDLFYMQEIEAQEAAAKAAEEEDEKMAETLSNDKFILAITTMWYSFTDEQQQHFINNHKDDERGEAVRQALKASANMSFC